MKKRLLIIASCVSIMLLSCKKASDYVSTIAEITKESRTLSTNAGEEFVTSFWAGNNSYLTENFALYHNDSNSRLQIFDVASKSDRVFCFDPGCQHDKHRKVEVSPDGIETVVEEGCMGYNISGYPVMVQEDRLYFVDFQGDVVQSNLQGENRKVITTFPPYIPAQRLTFSKDVIFGDYTTSYKILEIKKENGESDWIFGDRNEKQIAGIGRVNLKDGTAAEIFKREDYDARIFNVAILGTHLYFAYIYSDMPYMTPDGEMWDPMPDEWKALSVEEYLEERKKRRWMDIYDYDIVSEEIKCIKNGFHSGRVNFYDDFFAVMPQYPEDNVKTILYRYTGESFRELEGFRIYSEGFRCDHLVGVRAGEIQMIDVETGEVIKSVPEDYSFIPKVFIGESCYGMVVREKTGSGYISTEDFWNGKFENAIQFKLD